MEITLKDATYFVTLLVSVLGIYYRLLYKVEKLESEQKVVYKIIFRDDGTLNVLDARTCKDHRDLIEKGMQPIAANIEVLSDNVRSMDKKITVLLYHMKITDKEMVKYG